MTLRQRIRHNLPKYLQIFKELVSKRSLAALDQKGIEEAANYVKTLLEERGYEVELWRSGGSPVVHGYLTGRKRNFFIYNHYDVQPPDPIELWKSDPFTLTEVDGRLVGRGVADNKGNIVARLMATDMFIQDYGEHPIEWFIEGEEEIGSPSLPKIIKEYGSKVIGGSGLWETGYVRPDNRLEFPLGYKGMLYIEVVLKTLDTDAHSGNAPVLPNPVYILAEKLLKLKSVDGVLKQDFLVKGISKQYLADAEELIDKIPLTGLEKLYEVYNVDEAFRRLDRASLEKLYLKPSINVAGIKSGYIGEGSKTIVPSEAMVKMDFRPLPGQDPEEILNDLKRFFQEDSYGSVEVKVHGKYRSGYTKYRSMIVQTTIEAAKDAYGSEPVVTPISPGSGPISLFTDDLGIELAGAGVGYYGSRVHAPNENIRIEDFVLGVEHVYRLLERYWGYR